MENDKNDEFWKFKFSKYGIFQNIVWKLCPTIEEDERYISNHVPFEKDMLPGFQRTINRIGITPTTHYMHIQSSLDWWEISSNKKQKIEIFDRFKIWNLSKIPLATIILQVQWDHTYTILLFEYDWPLCETTDKS